MFKHFQYFKGLPSKLNIYDGGDRRHWCILTFPTIPITRLLVSTIFEIVDLHSFDGVNYVPIFAENLDFCLESDDYTTSNFRRHADDGTFDRLRNLDIIIDFYENGDQFRHGTYYAKGHVHIYNDDDVIPDLKINFNQIQRAYED